MKAKEFARIKSLLGAEVKGSDVERITGRSGATIASVKKSGSFQDYKKLIFVYCQNKKARDLSKKLGNPVPQIAIEDEDRPEPNSIMDMDDVVRKLDEILKVLDKTYELKLSAVNHAKSVKQGYIGKTGHPSGFFGRFLEPKPTIKS